MKMDMLWLTDVLCDWTLSLNINKRTHQCFEIHDWCTNSEFH